ncbi:hypothetical protein F5148DRAFT_1148973 [Russula earlei]|uniref:Uncharacterized protein n=2 Tax=Russula earlei TaxID=71964 RepID=A0ACC0TU11_9AGAM|nr:hypothetical protein F5148DRAFT_1153319 [Russula earlei]KAI9508519.1 hypothetical protein F5148DRAFT_1148973 [Russula earlei]
MAMPELPLSSQLQQGGAGDGKKVWEKEPVEPCRRHSHGHVAIMVARSSQWPMGHAQDSWPSWGCCGHAQVVVIVTTAVPQEERGMGSSGWKGVEEELVRGLTEKWVMGRRGLRR